jgi:hypothetical protein
MTCDIDLTLSSTSIGHFTKLSYDAHGHDDWEQLESATYLQTKGWSFVAFDGTTGAAGKQVASCSGVLGMNASHVVLSTRGTKMTSLDDWLTNFRFSRNPIASLFSFLFPETTNKIHQISCQVFGGHVHGEVANGFLQTHLSSWDAIKSHIIKYAEQMGLQPSDLTYTCVGHSKGAAKAQLNALHLLTDEDLNIGNIITVQEEFDMTASFVRELGLTSGFICLAQKSEPVNAGNVKTVVFESPHVFDSLAAPCVESILEKPNVLRIENRKLGSAFLFRDTVVDVAPTFTHIGTCAPVDGNGMIMANRHPLGKVVTSSKTVIDDHNNGVYISACSEEFLLPIGTIAGTTWWRVI